MGNRALIATKRKDVEVYLHWNGGVESVKAFCDFCKVKGYREPEDDCYGWARLCQVIGNFFGGTLSVGICKYGECCEEDNGRYVIENWEIVNHKKEMATMDKTYYDRVLEGVNKAQPEKEQLSQETIELMKSGEFDKIKIPYE